MPLRIIAIVPKSTKVVNTQLQGLAISREMIAIGADLHQSMAKYPPARPWKSRPPPRGPRRGGRRTGFLGRNWQVKVRREGAVVVEVEVSNKTPYAVYVQGPRRGGKGERQTKVMRDRGWQNITTITQVVWRKHRAGLSRAIRVGK